jgi:hypothetical protein
LAFVPRFARHSMAFTIGPILAIRTKNMGVHLPRSFLPPAGRRRSSGRASAAEILQFEHADLVISKQMLGRARGIEVVRITPPAQGSTSRREEERQVCIISGAPAQSMTASIFFCPVAFSNSLLLGTRETGARCRPARWQGANAASREPSTGGDICQ